MTSPTTIKASLHIHQPAVEIHKRGDLPLITDLDDVDEDFAFACLRDALSEHREAEIAIPAMLVPERISFRKLSGSARYHRAPWKLFEMLGLVDTEHRVLGFGEHARFTLVEPDQVVVVRLMDVVKLSMAPALRDLIEFGFDEDDG